MKDTNFLWKINPKDLCDMIQLCSVRERNWIYMVAVKRLDWTMEELPLDTIALSDSFEWSIIERSYSSGHVFINDAKDSVFLVWVEKNWRKQYQFTWWSPMEDQFKDIFVEENSIVKIKLYNVEDNALIRTKNRTWVDVIDVYNDKPLVDWALLENQKEDWTIFWRLVLLMHFVVKSFDWELWYKTWIEDVVDWKWFLISEISNTPWIAPNALIVTKKALELIK